MSSTTIIIGTGSALWPTIAAACSALAAGASFWVAWRDHRWRLQATRKADQKANQVAKDCTFQAAELSFQALKIFKNSQFIPDASARKDTDVLCVMIDEIYRIYDDIDRSKITPTQASLVRYAIGLIPAVQMSVAILTRQSHPLEIYPSLYRLLAATVIASEAMNPSDAERSQLAFFTADGSVRSQIGTV